MRGLVAAILLAALTSCGYALVGRGIAIDPSIKTVGVPLFEDNTGRTGLDQLVTDHVIEELLRRGRFEVVQTTEGVDAIVEGHLDTDGVFYADTLMMKCPTRYDEAVPEQAAVN